MRQYPGIVLVTISTRRGLQSRKIQRAADPGPPRAQSAPVSVVPVRGSQPPRPVAMWGIRAKIETANVRVYDEEIAIEGSKFDPENEGSKYYHFGNV